MSKIEYKDHPKPPVYVDWADLSDSDFLDRLEKQWEAQFAFMDKMTAPVTEETKVNLRRVMRIARSAIRWQRVRDELERLTDALRDAQWK